MNKNRKKNRETESTAEAKLKGFLDMIAQIGRASCRERV